MSRFATLFAALLFALPALAGAYRAEQIPNVQRLDARRYVSNPDAILSPRAVARIDSLCAALRAQGIAQVAVVAVNDIEGGDPFSFAIDLFRGWGVGRASDDNGLGVLLVKDLREIRFVTGGGLEGVLTDALSRRIQLRYMLPEFRQGNFDAGMVDGMTAVAQVLEAGGLPQGGPGQAPGELPYWVVLLIVAGFLLVPTAILTVVYYLRKRCPRCHKLTLRQQSQQVLAVTPAYRLIEHTFVCSNCGYVVKRQVKNLRDDNIGGRGGGTIIGGLGGFGAGRGFGGGGGFGGGFGGGSFGGGGAGSRW